LKKKAERNSPAPRKKKKKTIGTGGRRPGWVSKSGGGGAVEEEGRRGPDQHSSSPSVKDIAESHRKLWLKNTLVEVGGKDLVEGNRRGGGESKSG